MTGSASHTVDDLHSPGEIVSVDGMAVIRSVISGRLGGGGGGGNGGGGDGGGGALGDSARACAGQSPPCCMPGNPSGMWYTTPSNVCGCVVLVGGDAVVGGGGGGAPPSCLSTVRAPTPACSAPAPRSTYRIWGASAGLGKASSTTAWHAAFCVQSAVASPKPLAELRLCSGAPVCV